MKPESTAAPTERRTNWLAAELPALLQAVARLFFFPGREGFFSKDGDWRLFEGDTV